MKKIAVAFLCGNIFVFGNVSALEEIIAKIPKVVKSTSYTPDGELCTKEADAKGLVSREWRKFMFECAMKNQKHDPYKDAVAACFAKHSDKKGEAWETAMKDCGNAIEPHQK